MLQLILTFLPVITVLATALAAAVTTGLARWIALLGVPLLGTALSWAALPVSGQNGNMLAVALLLILTVGVALYCPVMLVLLIVRRRRRRP